MFFLTVYSHRMKNVFISIVFFCPKNPKLYIAHTWLERTIFKEPQVSAADRFDCIILINPWHNSLFNLNHYKFHHLQVNTTMNRKRHQCSFPNTFFGNELKELLTLFKTKFFYSHRSLVQWKEETSLYKIYIWVS